MEEDIASQQKKLKEKKVYEVEKGKKVSRVALLTGCVQRVISPEINESTIRLLNRHNVEVVVMPDINCCGSLNHHLGKQKLAHESFKNNINCYFCIVFIKINIRSIQY